MSDSSESAAKGLGLFSTLQAATELRFFFLSVAFTLLTDNALVWTHQPGIMAIAGDPELMSRANLPIKIILIFVGFSFLSSIALPLLAAFVDAIYLATIGSWLTSLHSYLDVKTGALERSARRRHDCVSPIELRDEAHLTKDKYYLDLYKDHQQKLGDDRKNTMRFALYAFYCLTMLCWNAYLGWTPENTLSIVFSTFLGDKTYVFYAILIFFVMFVSRFHEKSEPNWIYCPSLYRKITDAENHRR
ncbi:hypothetical protein [Burkholderia savannae]|uniref:hypothetical protein n=1 Tax=Burkholderia savannae TaxID=1637837 RepID=UPI0012F49E5D|nr:hypothetical protein [Burkholderia savannae]